MKPFLFAVSHFSMECVGFYFTKMILRITSEWEFGCFFSHLKIIGFFSCRKSCLHAGLRSGLNLVPNRQECLQGRCRKLQFHLMRVSDFEHIHLLTFSLSCDWTCLFFARESCEKEQEKLPNKHPGSETKTERTFWSNFEEINDGYGHAASR